MDKEQLYTELLNKFKPILVIYAPQNLISENNEYKIDALKNMFNKSTNNSYYIFVLPWLESNFKLEVLSVLKNDYIKDCDLKKHFEKIQLEIFKEDMKLYSNKSTSFKDIKY